MKMNQKIFKDLLMEMLKLEKEKCGPSTVDVVHDVEK